MESKQRLCRICAQLEEDEKFRPILRQNDETASQIFNISNITIIDYPDFPALICNNCFRNLYIATNFRNLCRKSDNLFKSKIYSFEINKWKSELENLNVDEIADKEQVVAIKTEPVDSSVVQNDWKQNTPKLKPENTVQRALIESQQSTSNITSSENVSSKLRQIYGPSHQNESIDNETFQNGSMDEEFSEVDPTYYLDLNGKSNNLISHVTKSENIFSSLGQASVGYEFNLQEIPNIHEEFQESEISMLKEQNKNLLQNQINMLRTIKKLERRLDILERNLQQNVMLDIDLDGFELKKIDKPEEFMEFIEKIGDSGYRQKTIAYLHQKCPNGVSKHPQNGVIKSIMHTLFTDKFINFCGWGAVKNKMNPGIESDQTLVKPSARIILSEYSPFKKLLLDVLNYMNKLEPFEPVHVAKALQEFYKRWKRFEDCESSF